jgi:OOP family OmpA-OmpF porin
VRRTLRAAAIVGVVTLLAGCAYTHPKLAVKVRNAMPSCVRGVTGPVVLVIGARANEPAPSLPASVNALITQAVYDGQSIDAVTVDGDPQRQFSAPFSSTAENDLAWRDDVNKFEAAVAAKIATLRAVTPEADPLEAISRAGDEAGPSGTVVLIDSGLQTVNPLNFADPGELDADPADIADFLAANHELPHLKGLAVMFVGIGQTARPQAPLDTAQRDNLLAIWEAIATRAGARCYATASENLQPHALSGMPAVTPVLVPAPPNPQPNPKQPVCGSPTILRDAGKVRFKGDQAVFVDVIAARSALTGYATLIKSKHLKVHLIGTTASAGDSEPGKIKLSLERAAAVKQVLVDLGVTATDITTAGLGDKYPGYVLDRDSKGNLVPAKAALNRNVIVQFSGCA